MIYDIFRAWPTTSTYENRYQALVRFTLGKIMILQTSWYLVVQWCSMGITYMYIYIYSGILMIYPLVPSNVANWKLIYTRGDFPLPCLITRWYTLHRILEIRYRSLFGFPRFQKSWLYTILKSSAQGTSPCFCFLSLPNW